MTQNTPAATDGRELPVPTESGATVTTARVVATTSGADVESDATIAMAHGRTARGEQLRINASIHHLLTALVIGGALYTCYFASDLILPILLAMFFALLLSPAMKRLTRGWLPRWIAALLLVMAFLAVLVGIGNALYSSASDWVARAPQVLHAAAPKLKAMARPFQEATRMGESIGNLAGANSDPRDRTITVSSGPTLLSTTPKLVASILAVILLTYFFLVYSDNLLRKLLTLRPTWAQKRWTVDVVRAIQSDLSRYVLTICATSLALGTATAGYLWALGFESPILWGAVAAVLNLTPYVGPMVMAGMLALIGLAQFSTVTTALLPAAGYLGLHLLESQLITPIALGHTISVNPLAIILWLLIWGWLWGVIGLLLAVPMLVCVKIVCSRIDGLQAFATLIEK